MQILNPPTRAYDSREHSKFIAGETRLIPLGVSGSAAFVNLTVVTPAGRGYVSAWGDGGRPNVSAVNFEPGVTIANAVPVPMTGGAIQVFSMAPCDLVVDVYGVWE